MKKVIREINHQTNLEMNLPQYGNYLMNLYYKSAVAELTMDYYTFYEMLSDGEKIDAKLQSYTDEFNHILEETVLETRIDAEREKAVAQIDSLRNKVYRTVSALMAYADIFARYEYVSNRCEYLFKDSEKYDRISDEDFTREIMQYIFSEEDNTVINNKIAEIVAELPIRLTKNKFFQYLSDGFSVYSKTDKQTIDDFVYMLKTSAMLEQPEGLEEYETLYEIYHEIEKLSYAEITEEQFHNLEAKLQYAADFIDEETNLFMILQGLINRAYVLIIAAPYVDNSDSESKACLNIIRSVHACFGDREYISLPDDVTDTFAFLEGVPERNYEQLQSVEYVLDTIKNNHIGIVKNIMVDTIYQGLFMAQNLLADSLFVDLSDIENIFEEKNKAEAEVDAECYVTEMRDSLIADLTEFFKNHQKLVNKSVMSVILSYLPVFFNNITEIQDYVYNALSNCTNEAEKQAAIEIIKCIMNIN